MGKIKGLGYVAIFTNEFAKTYEFYSEKLGLSTEWSDKKKMAMLKAGDFNIFIHPKKSKGKFKTGDLHLHLLVDDVDSYFKKLKAKKVRLPKAPKSTSWGYRTFHAKDPNGIEWEFYHPEKK